MTVSNFDEVKNDFLMDIKAVITVEEIPDGMVVNWKHSFSAASFTDCNFSSAAAPIIISDTSTSTKFSPKVTQILRYRQLVMMTVLSLT